MKNESGYRILAWGGLDLGYAFLLDLPLYGIREIPDHATFREKENTLGWLDKLVFSLSLTLCNLATFDQLYLPKYRCYNLV